VAIFSVVRGPGLTLVLEKDIRSNKETMKRQKRNSKYKPTATEEMEKHRAI